jgi:hypothetical protein
VALSERRNKLDASYSFARGFQRQHASDTVLDIVRSLASLRRTLWQLFDGFEEAWLHVVPATWLAWYMQPHEEVQPKCILQLKGLLALSTHIASLI